MKHIGLLLLFLNILWTSNIFAQNPVSLKMTQKTLPSVLAFARKYDASEMRNVIDLNGAWTFKATDEAEWKDAVVPGTVHQDLIRIGRLEDPFYRDNEFDAQWVEKKEWEYKHSFIVEKTILAKDKILLDCRGLDCICELYVNDSLVAKTQNMFIEYEFDVKKYLHEGNNSIRAVFRSVLEWNKKQAVNEPRVTWAKGNNATNDAWKGLLFFSRKEASDFGWDWGIRLLSCGIWKPIQLIAYNTGRIKELEVKQDLSNPSKVLLSISADIESYRSSNMRIAVKVTLEGKIIDTKSFPIINTKAAGQIIISNPRLWWPNGLGEHPLYTVKAELYAGKNLVHSKQIRIGLRTIALSQEKDERGQSFGIKVNGKLIFCKGANWIPADALPNRLTEAKYKELLGSCIDANMNMIRLWGGGLYESEAFYDFCDENGLMIWHDFMFATGPYLAVDSYLKNVREEIKNVVLRLRHHPAIALWCGNNESEINMAGGQNWLKLFPTTSWKDYDKIFNETIPQTAFLYDPDRPYFPSSPHNPLDREEKNSDWQTISGTAHTYEVWGGTKRFDAYNEMGKYRFVAEFGFQSLPHAETIRAFTKPEDRYFPSLILDHHNLTGRKPNQNQGNVRIAQYTADMFRMPAGMMNWISVSQILQGEGMKMGCEALRRNFPNSTGALYWQLNDNWPVISWSSIDYFGRWKALQYMAKRFFSPVMVSGIVRNDSALIYASNDLLNEKQCKLEWVLSGFDGKEESKGSIDVLLQPLTSFILTRLDLSKFVKDDPELSTYRKESYRKKENLYLSVRLKAGDSILSSNVLFFLPPKYWQLEKPEIKYTLNSEKGRKKIVLTANRFAAFVELGLNNGYARFSDNFFHLLPGETKTIYVVSSEVSDDQFSKQFYVKSLIDTYTTNQEFTSRTIRKYTGLWSSEAELKKNPTSGPAWDAVKKAADLDFSKPVINNNNSDDDVNCLAASIVYARTGDQSYKNKVVAALEYNVARANPGFDPTGTLTWCRNTGAYALSADLIGYRTPAFETWLRNMVETYRDTSNHNNTIEEIYYRRANNWGTQAFGTLCAVYGYLDDTTKLVKIRNYWVQMVTGPNPGATYGSDISWHSDPNNLRLINPKGAVKSGLNIDGIMPDDMRRNGVFSNPPPKSVTSYHWEALQGIISGARILERIDPALSIWETGDKAILRAVKTLETDWRRDYNINGSNWAAIGDDAWMLPFIDAAYGTDFTKKADDPSRLWEHGKNAGWAYVLPL